MTGQFGYERDRSSPTTGRADHRWCTLTPPLVDSHCTTAQPAPDTNFPMKIRSVAGVLAIALPLLAAPARAAEATTSVGWHAQNLGQAVGYMILFATIGILAAIAGYKLFDKCTPGDLHLEILEKQNVAAAIVAGSVILGVCIIIAAAMIG